MIRQIYITLMILCILGCAGNNPKSEIDIETHFNQGMKFLKKKKYLRAQEKFNYVILSGSHTELGDDALYYLGESYFMNKEYLLAIAEFDRLTRRMAFSPFVEKARWRICESYVTESPKYYHDQTYTDKALTKLQEFLDDYPRSEFSDTAKKEIDVLRIKMAKKAYGIGILYIKLGVYDSAIIAFNDLITKYYDTEFAELAHVGIIRSYSLMLDVDTAKEYYQSHHEIIRSDDSNQKVKRYLSEANRKIEKKRK